MFNSRFPAYCIFAKNGETYYLPSMLRLDLYGYLYYQLKKSGYENVYIIESKGIGNAASVFVTHRDKGTSEPVAVTSGKKSIFTSLFSGQRKKAKTEDDGSFSAAPDNSFKAAAEWVYHQLSKSNTALIVDYKTLNSLYDKLSDKMKNNLVSMLKGTTAAGSLIVTFQVELAMELLQSMLDSNSLFRAFFSGIDALSSEIPLFEQLKQGHSSRIIELTDIEFDELVVIADNAFFDKDYYVDGDERIDLLNFLYYWLYCRELRLAAIGTTGIFKGADEMVTRKQLFDFLCGNNENSIRERITQLRRGYDSGDSLAYILGERYGKRNTIRKPEDSRIKLQIAQLSMLESMEYPIWETNTDYSKLFNIVPLSKSEWDNMRLKIRMPRAVLPDEKKLMYISKFCAQLKRASNCGDYCTVCRAANALMYCSNTLFNGSEEGVLTDFSSYIEISKAFYSNYRTLRKAADFQSGSLSEHGRLMQDARMCGLKASLNTEKEALDILDTHLLVMSSYNADHNLIQNSIAKALEAMKKNTETMAVDNAAALDPHKRFEEGSADEEQQTVSSSFEGINCDMSLEEVKAQLMQDANKLI